MSERTSSRVGEEALFSPDTGRLTLGARDFSCGEEVGDVHEVETARSEGQVGMVALDGQIDVRAIDQVGNQDIVSAR